MFCLEQFSDVERGGAEGEQRLTDGFIHATLDEAAVKTPSAKSTEVKCPACNGTGFNGHTAGAARSQNLSTIVQEVRWQGTNDEASQLSRRMRPYTTKERQNNRRGGGFFGHCGWLVVLAVAFLSAR